MTKTQNINNHIFSKSSIITLQIEKLEDTVFWDENCVKALIFFTYDY